MDSVTKSGGGGLRVVGLETRHWAPLPRRHPGQFLVETTGYIARKEDWIRHRFSTCNFSFILSGGGEYRWGGRVWEVRAPCVLLQWPGARAEYGPTAPWGCWEELYLIYPARSLRRLKAAGFFRRDFPCWKVRDSRGLQEKLEELARLMAESAAAEGRADRVDRVCEALILESVLAETTPEPDAAEAAVRRIVRGVRQRLGRRIDWAEEARGEGLSLSTFRRRWREVAGVPPAEALERWRMRAACRMLVETQRTIAGVAEACGYEDALYFSRRFRAFAGLAPRDYRKRYQNEGAREAGAGD